MAEQQSEQPVIFIRRLLTRLIRELENFNGRSDHIDSVLYRIDWFYNSLVRYLGAYNSVSDHLVGIVRDAKDLLTLTELSRYLLVAVEDQSSMYQEFS